MIQPQSIVKIADNTGAKIGRIFKVLGSSKKRYARLGEMVVRSEEHTSELPTRRSSDLYDSASINCENRRQHRSKDRANFQSAW